MQSRRLIQFKISYFKIKSLCKLNIAVENTDSNLPSRNQNPIKLEFGGSWLKISLVNNMQYVHQKELADVCDRWRLC